MDKKRKFNMGIRKYTQTIFGVVFVISLIATVGYAEDYEYIGTTKRRAKIQGPDTNHMIDVATYRKKSSIEISDLIPYIINVESGGDQHAVGKAGEIGLMQISPIILEEWQEILIPLAIKSKSIPHMSRIFEKNLGSLYNPEFNIEIGTWYLYRLRDHYLKDHYNIYTLLASYNWGIGNVKKVNYNPKRFPRSVKRYINKVLTIWNKAHPLDRKELLK